MELPAMTYHRIEEPKPTVTEQRKEATANFTQAIISHVAEKHKIPVSHAFDMVDGDKTTITKRGAKLTFTLTIDPSQDHTSSDPAKGKKSLSDTLADGLGKLATDLDASKSQRGQSSFLGAKFASNKLTVSGYSEIDIGQKLNEQLGENHQIDLGPLGK